MATSPSSRFRPPDFLIQTPPILCTQRLAPPNACSLLLPTYILSLYSADKGMEGEALSPATPPIVPHTTTGRPSPPTPLALGYQCKNACSSFPYQPLALSQVIHLLRAFDQLVSLARKPVYLFPAYFGELGRQPTSSSCSTEWEAVGQGVVSIRRSIRAREVECSLLPLSFVAVATVYRGAPLSFACLRRREGSLLKLLLLPSCRS